MRFKDLSWMDVERYLQQDNRVIFITGATEQHAFLSLSTDILIPEKIADEIASREKVLIAPPLNFGISSLFEEFPGTISLSPDIFNAVLSEIVEGLSHQGFTRFFFLNGHGGNTLPPYVEELQREELARYEWYEWWRTPVIKEFEARHSLHLDHANWGENFPFNRLGQSPQAEKPNVNLDMLQTGAMSREILGDGSFGGPYQVDDKLMFELFDLVVEDAATKLRSLKE